MTDARWTACENKALAVLSMVFLSGLALGAVGMRAYDRGHPTMSDIHEPALHSPESVMALEKLTETLELTEDQQSRIHVILDESIMSEADLLGQLREVQADGRRRILGVLTEEQRVRLDDVVLQAAE